jgi:hypothetical protein
MEPPSSFFQQKLCVGSPKDLVPSDSLPNSCRNITSADFSKDKEKKNEGCQDHQRLTILSKNQEILWIIPSPTTGKGILWGMAGARCNVVWIRRGDFVWTLLGGTID